MKRIAEFIKAKRRAAGLTQAQFAKLSGLERGKDTVRLDKVNIALSVFGMEAIPGIKETY